MRRVFSTAKNVMQLNATRLGHQLFAAMVRLRHNSALIETWTTSLEEAHVVVVSLESEEDAQLASTLASVAKVTKVNVFEKRKQTQKATQASKHVGAGDKRKREIDG